MEFDYSIQMLEEILIELKDINGKGCPFGLPSAVQEKIEQLYAILNLPTT